MSNKSLSRNKRLPVIRLRTMQPAYMTYALNRLRPLQCGEAYYSVYATNNPESDEPIQAYKAKRFHLFSMA
jgi:hypothetical protein